MTDDAERIIALYERHARAWDGLRWKSLFERPWLDRFMVLLPRQGSVLDIGCGSGEPIGRYFIEAGYGVTGADSSAAMIDMCRSRFPAQTWIVADMRKLSLSRRFNGVLAWDSFFHLSQDDQRRMFPVFQAHAATGAPLMFTSGPHVGVAMGTFQDEPLHHASLDPAEYRALLDAHGFGLISYMPEDPSCGGHTIWLARAK